MKQKITLLFSMLLTIAAPALYANGQADSSKIHFENTFNELKEMLEEKTSPNFERAVFISENAYQDNKYSYQNFQNGIDVHLYCIKKLIEANNKSDSIDFNVKVNANGRFKMDDIRYLPKEKKELYRKALTNWAIFTYLTDTTFLYPIFHLPFNYTTHDPFGMKDWSNSQVINLLISKEQKGNCFALTGLFKILSDRLNSEARICTAPQHIYIQHRDHKGDYYNVELATAGHPGDGLIQVLTYTTSDAIKSGIALRSYDEKQNTGLCLVNLAKSYEHKFQTKEDEFILRCADLVLQHDSLNLNALLLKQQALEARVANYAVKNKISDINRLKQDPKISKIVSSLEKHLALLYRLGYRQMPMDMQQMVLDGFRNEDNGSIRINKNPSPFTTVKPKDPNDAQYWTLTHGAFQEVFEVREFEPYGHFTFKTATKKITAIDTASRTGFLIDPVAFAYDFGARMYDARLGIFTSVDPLANKSPGWSPYVAFNANPILNIDKDGNFSLTIHKNITENLPSIKNLNSVQVFFLVVGNLNTDILTLGGYAENWHFDNLKNFGDVTQYWQNVNKSIANRASWDVYGLGADLHSIQDFYSHSNYVELYVEYYKGKNEGNDPSDIPTFDEASTDKEFSSILEKNLRTGEFGLTSEKGPTHHENMNKDEGEGLVGKLAVKTATKHSEKVLSKFLARDKEQEKIQTTETTGQ